MRVWLIIILGAILAGLAYAAIELEVRKEGQPLLASAPGPADEGSDAREERESILDQAAAPAAGPATREGAGDGAAPADGEQPSGNTAVTLLDAGDGNSGDAATSTPSPAPAGQGEGADEADEGRPTFDVVSVDPDGTAVFAGRAEPGASVSVHIDGEEVGTAEATERGEWVIIPDERLSGGTVTLELEATPSAGGETVASSQQVTVIVPEDEDGEIVIAGVPADPEPTPATPAQGAPSAPAAAAGSQASAGSTGASAGAATPAAPGSAGDAPAAAPAPATQTPGAAIATQPAPAGNITVDRVAEPGASGASAVSGEDRKEAELSGGSSAAPVAPSAPGAAGETPVAAAPSSGASSSGAPSGGTPSGGSPSGAAPSAGAAAVASGTSGATQPAADGSARPPAAAAPAAPGVIAQAPAGSGAAGSSAASSAAPGQSPGQTAGQASGQGSGQATGTQAPAAAATSGAASAGAPAVGGPVSAPGSAAPSPAPSSSSTGTVVVLSEPGQPTRVLQGPSDGAEPGAPLAFDTVDYDDQGSIIIAGQGEAGADVRAYIDNELLGDTRADAEGRWTLRATRDITPGEYELRVDRIDQQGIVVARAAAPFERVTPDIAAAARERTVVTIRPGDNLWNIAREIYGAGVQYTVIYNANTNQIIDPDLIYPGQVLLTPGGAVASPATPG